MTKSTKTDYQNVSRRLFECICVWVGVGVVNYKAAPCSGSGRIAAYLGRGLPKGCQQSRKSRRLKTVGAGWQEKASVLFILTDFVFPPSCEGWVRTAAWKTEDRAFTSLVTSCCNSARLTTSTSTVGNCSICAGWCLLF